MADIAATGIVDYPDRRIVYFPAANLQSVLQAPRELVRPDPPFTDYVPQYAGNEARFKLPKITEKYSRCLISCSLPPSLLFLNTANAIAVNMKCSYLFFAANLLFDGKPTFTNFLSENEEFYVDASLRQIVLGTCFGKLKIDPINMLPEVGVNNTRLDFPLDTAGTARAAILFRPTVTFLK